jgi:hypothetical protein
VDADIEELIVIADELRVVEERLVEIDPDRTPLPPFDDDGISHEPNDLDAYEPEGEWNIDGTDVDPEDVLVERPQKTVVHLSQIRPRSVLVGEEE